VAVEVAAALQRIPDRIEAALRRDLEAATDIEPAAIARALYGAATALGEVRGSRTARARLAASVVPEAAVAEEAWPVA